MGGMNIRNNIARIGATALIGCGLVATSVPATFAVEGAPQTVYTYADSAQFIAPDTWYEGQGLNIGGEGFKTADGTSGSVLALKLNKGAVKINGQDYLEIHADSDGNFSATIPWQEELHGSVSVDIYLKRPPHPQLRTLRKPSPLRTRSLPKSRSLRIRSPMSRSLTASSTSVSRTAPTLRLQVWHRFTRATRITARSSTLTATTMVASSPLTTRTPRSLTASA